MTSLFDQDPPPHRITAAEHKMLGRPRSADARRRVVRDLVGAWGAEQLVGALVDAGIIWPGQYTGDRETTALPSTVVDYGSGFRLVVNAAEVWPGGGIMDYGPILPFDGCDDCLESRCHNCWPPATLAEMRPCRCDCHRRELSDRVRDIGFAEGDGGASS